MTATFRHPLAAALLLAFGRAGAATIDVDVGADAHVSGHCTLREAILAANTHATPPDTNCAAGDDGGNTIGIPPSLSPIELTDAALDVADAGGTTTIRSTVSGTPVAVRRVSGSGPVFSASRPVRFEDLSISGGHADMTGGGISAGATEVTLTRCRVSGNWSTYFGGGILISDTGTLTLTDSTVSDNATGPLGLGGGIASDDGSTITLVGSTVSGNSAGDGGGLFVWKGSLSLSNSTVSGNTAASDGGGIGTYQLDSFELIHATIAGNAAVHGAGIRLYSRAAQGTLVRAHSSLLAGNTGSPDIEHLGGADDIVTGSDNLIGQIGEHVSYPPDTLRCDPQLAPLADNGGPTWTHALPAGSCAVDAGGVYLWSDYDQRGPDHPRWIGTAVDIGAYEYDPDDVDDDRLFADGFD
ncbi:right-handed parallel beta-helix repeat-containing protein [Dokdonella sp.]|uniref:right-handed parallel beta-helix repeat-containing protein n=1 Tax=Dokdonella sp. TaxID=2291710 RepID=UPI001B03D7C8|nr:right-handed parallel beta-helix repeat-containing protein [Dokdonella sp.]MBO9661319.1 right-handed parallel beta-helix repeat-containing protein [Dokdonella sp.]